MRERPVSIQATPFGNSIGVNASGQPGIIGFIQRQIRQIREGGYPVALRKFRRLVNEVAFLLSLPVALPAVLLVRSLRPLVRIRFGALISLRIGHFAANTELYLCERDAGIHPPNAIDIFYHMKPICNRQLQKMWERTGKLRIVQLASVLDRINRLLPGSLPHVAPLPDDRDRLGLLTRFSPHLAFTDEEERRGRIALQALGVPEGTPFVCFHARDSAYLDTVLDGDFHYHDYRDSCIHNHIPAVEELARRGYFAIRTGAIVREKLATRNPRIIDYATNGRRTEFLDVFLGSKCRFFVSVGAGIDAIPTIFLKPIVFVNYVPVEYVRSWSPNFITIFKKHWLRDEHRFLTFREILHSGIGRFLFTEQFEQHGIELLENTPEEITAVTVEMEERLKGTWQATEEDEELQHRFWTLFKPSELNGVFRARIGAEFLRQNRELLD